MTKNLKTETSATSDSPSSAGLFAWLPMVAAGSVPTGLPAWGPLGAYVTDAMQRTILFWDVMRQRSDQYYEQKSKAVPHVLSFDSELVLDARTFDKPVNYLLVRVKPPQGMVVDPVKRPFVVVDPRAGHGPGIGGFKADSELGVAMRAGHPCYFVGFTPEPMPGQTIEDIVYAEATFLEKVIALHPEAEGKPCVIGNCQGGWSVMMVAAIRPELFGPIIVAGSPLSYWAGAKNYNLWSKVDTEGPRFIEFEKWWGGHVNLTAEEIQWIVDQLFVGNRLATAEIVTNRGDRIDLRNIRSPIVCFCSKGDNITPPQQALGWIVDLYGTDEDLRACGQTIVYAVHDTIGHLGIFVSGGVAKKEHQEFASNIDLIDVLPPGLYEAVLTPVAAETVNAERVTGDWVARFEPRTLNDVRAIVRPDLENERRFAAVRRVSEINLGLYRMLLQPFVKAFVNEQSAEWLHKLNAAELPFQIFSQQNPLMKQVAQLAEQVRAQRQPVSPDNPLLQWQKLMSEGIVSALDGYRDLRDRSIEQIFLGVYGSPVLQVMLGLRANDEAPRKSPGIDPSHAAFVQRRIGELKARMAEGGPREAAIRAGAFVGMGGAGSDERVFNELRQIRAENQGLTLQAFKQVFREQCLSLTLDRDAALAAIPKMLPPDAASRRALLATIRRTVEAAGPLSGEKAERMTTIERLFAGGGAVERVERAPRTMAASAPTTVSKGRAKVR